MALNSAYDIRYNIGMSNKNVKKLLEEREFLLRELSSLRLLLHGSFVERYSVCSRAECKCHDGERHGPRRYLVVREGGKQRQKYIPNRCVGKALEGVEQGRRLREIAHQLTRVNLALMKEENSYGE